MKRLGFSSVALTAWLLSFWAFSGCRQTQAPAADWILHNGKIVTLGEPALAAAMAIREGRVWKLGDNASVLAFEGPSTRVVDLNGKSVLPGFTDNHFHSIGGGPGVDLSETRTIEEVIDAIRERAQRTEANELIRTNSDWHEGQLAEQRLVYRDELDRASTEHPIVVARGGHEYILNSRALERWNIDEDTQAPEGGTIGRYEDGRLNGELVDHAKSLVTLPPRSEKSADERLDALVLQHRALNRAGIVSVRYAGGTLEEFEDLRTLYEQERLSLRVDFLLRLPGDTPVDEIEKKTAPWLAVVNETKSHPWTRVVGIKLGVDGGFEGGLLSSPYEEPMGASGQYFGLQTVETQQFHQTVAMLNELGFRIATHAVGDAAIDLVLDAYDAAHETTPIADRRFSIEHAFVARDDQLPRMKALGVHISAQHHLFVAAPSLRAYWGDERAQNVTPLRTYIEAGIPVSLGTDAPVIPYPPLQVLYHFITRETLSAGVFGESERVDRKTALEAMARGYASLTFSEATRGSLEEGMLADFVVLDGDFLECPAEDIPELPVVMTVVGGDAVFEASSGQ